MSVRFLIEEIPTGYFLEVLTRFVFVLKLHQRILSEFPPGLISKDSFRCQSWSVSQSFSELILSFLLKAFFLHFCQSSFLGFLVVICHVSCSDPPKIICFTEFFQSFIKSAIGNRVQIRDTLFQIYLVVAFGVLIRIP